MANVRFPPIPDIRSFARSRTFGGAGYVPLMGRRGKVIRGRFDDRRGRASGLPPELVSLLDSERKRRMWRKYLPLWGGAVIARRVLQEARQPLSAKEILQVAYQMQIVPPDLFGRTQHKTLQARLFTDILTCHLSAQRVL